MSLNPQHQPRIISRSWPAVAIRTWRRRLRCMSWIAVVAAVSAAKTGSWQAGQPRSLHAVYPLSAIRNRSHFPDW